MSDAHHRYRVVHCTVLRLVHNFSVILGILQLYLVVGGFLHQEKMTCLERTIDT